MIDEIKNSLEESMDKSLQSLKYQLSKIRTGRASPNILDGIVVDYYGTNTPLNQLGQITTPEARLLQIQPFDKSILKSIEKSILGANLGVTPTSDGNVIRIPFPPLTEEKRKDLVKSIKKLGEDTRINIRNIRRDGNDKVKKAEKDKSISEDIGRKYLDEIQNFTDKYIKIVDDILVQKEKELLTV